MNQQSSSASPAKQAAKRRHTAAFASEGNAGPEKGVKRCKTLKTYGANRRQLAPADDDDNFDHFRDDDGPAATSQAVRFSEHSGNQSSMPLPAGSLQTDFQNHEPAVMFKDTGDTVADASSEQQRLYDQVLASNKGLSTSMTKDAQPGLEQNSSSIPWTASDIADSAKSKKSQRATNAEQQADVPADGLADKEDVRAREAVADAEEATPNDGEEGGLAGSQSRKVAKQDESAPQKPKSSPMVEIRRQESRKAMADSEAATKTQRASKGRSRKVEEESSEPLNSDDKAIGLPKERYQPRPSRRRATQVSEEPIDYSIRPEQAAKVKRTKSTGAKTSVDIKGHEFDPSQSLKPGVSPPGLSKDGRSGDARKEDGSPSKSNVNAAEIEEDDSPIKPRRSIKQKDVEEAAQPEPHAKEPPASPEKSKAAAQHDEDKIFVKPAIPTPKPKGSSRARRAQTTIFEDHVEFMGSRRSPNLSQQQAKRKSALEDVKNEAVSKSQRKRKAVVADDSDDEDELAKENESMPEKAASPPKKRRGRPAKSQKQAQSKATVKDSDEDEDHDEAQAEAEADESEAEEPPKKRRQGRTTKAASKANFQDINETAAAKESGKDPEKPSNNGEEVPQPASTPSKASAPAAEIPTPSPEKPTENANSTPQKATSSKTQHSPIKSSSKMPLRVGLSKRHRIPPLLRINKPPKR